MGSWLVAVALVAQASSTEPGASDRQAVLAALRSYHEAFQKEDVTAVSQLLGPSVFIADERSSEGPERVRAHLFLAGARLASWPGNFLLQAGPYRNSFETVSVSVRQDAAVALTRDTGSNRQRQWQNEEVTWFLGRTDGRWRIVGMMIRDIQLPSARTP